MKRALQVALATGSTVGLLALSAFALPWVRDVSGNLALDFLIIFAWAALAVTAGWFQVSLVMQPGRATDLPGAASGFSKPVLLRSALVVFSVLANLFWSNALAGNFWFGHYARIGTYATGLRSQDRQDRIWAMGRVAEMAREPVRDLVAPLAALMDDPDDEVRARAVAGLAHLARRMRVAVKTLEVDGDSHGRWEHGLLVEVKSFLGDPAIRVREETGMARRAWIFAVGGTGDRSAIPILGTVIDDGRSTPAYKVAAVEALVDIMHPDTLPALGRALKARETRVETYAAWALGLVTRSMVSLDPKEAGRDRGFLDTRDLLNERLPGLGAQAVCAYLGSFPEIGDSGLTPALMALSSSKVFLLPCTRIERVPWFGAPEPVVKAGTVAEAVLRSMASVALGNDRLKAHLERAVKEGGLPDKVRSRMNGILDEVSAHQR